MKRIYVASPLRGDYAANIKAAEAHCLEVARAGHNPYAPHLLLTRFLDDTVAEECEIGMRCGIDMIAVMDELWAWGDSSGVRAEIAEARRLSKPVRRMDVEPATTDPETLDGPIAERVAKWRASGFDVVIVMRATGRTSITLHDRAGYCGGHDAGRLEDAVVGAVISHGEHVALRAARE